MRYRIFGRRTGLRVSELALDAGNFGMRWGHGAERAEAKKVFDAYVEAGGNFIDTADGYQFGESEELVGEFIAAHRDYFFGGNLELLDEPSFPVAWDGGESTKPYQLAMKK
jgi:aryl-alcohol dehydrogenase-like predicted oxidoreductase